MSLVPQMSNTCVSRLLIPDSDQIQIVVTKVVPERGKSGVGGTDITVTTMNRGGGGQVSVGGGGRGGGGPNTAGLGIGNRRLPPLVIPGSLGVALNSGDERNRSRRLLSPCSDGKSPTPTPSRIPSPTHRRSSTNSVGGYFSSGGGGYGSLVKPPGSASVPASPTSCSTPSRYHRSCCIPNSTSLPSAFPHVRPLVGGSSTGSMSRSRSRSRSPYRGANSRDRMEQAGTAEGVGARGDINIEG
ncbi:hypothetical protein Fcan01_10061 [Folsomia candida]|uniref:Uncharacterized protein n=1 Tax=Folsomia candida TaxID=158441 RepID=A0A226EFG0_FOLCA|nr:hypothetical protein Fcan01_10061 [Folsomia candida]